MANFPHGINSISQFYAVTIEVNPLGYVCTEGRTETEDSSYTMNHECSHWQNRTNSHVSQAADGCGCV